MLFVLCPITQEKKYVLALKLSGVDALRETPMRYLELQIGLKASLY